jgi:hypothetical protein
MPQRILKPGITTSKKWNQMTWIAQSFYIRLLTLVDDFGRYEADPVLLKSHAFPLREDIRTPLVQQLCEELQANQLAIFYKVDGKAYIQFTNWTNKPRAESSLYPQITDKCEQMIADANICEQMLSKPLPEPLPLPKPLLSDFLEFWQVYPKKVGKGEAESSWQKIAPNDELKSKIISAVERQKKSAQWTRESGRFIPNPSTWLNQKRWEDELDLETDDDKEF